MNNIVIAIPTSRYVVDFRLAGWLYRIRENEHTKPTLVFKGMQPIDANRNALVQQFLEDEHNEWLLFLDDDMIPKFPLEELFKGHKKIVSALTCVMQNGVPGPLIMKSSPSTIKNPILFEPFKESDIDKQDASNRLIKVDGVGTGCLLIHRDVFKAIDPPWFRFQYTPDGLIELSEDYYFCEKVKKAGFELFIDPNCACGHAKYLDLYDMNKLMYRVATAKDLKIEEVKSEVGKLNG
jgi:hypothetical protein